VAATLDWDTQTWLPAGSLSEAYTIGSGDVTITWTGATGSLIQTRPQVAQSETGGLVPAQNSLSVRVNYPSSPSAITATIDFSHPGGVSGVSFTVFDVDRWTFFLNPFTDQLQVTATDGSSTFNPSSVSIYNPTYVSYDGASTVTGLQNVASATSPDGNVTFTFNQTGITRVTFVYRSPTGGPANPGDQYISIHDIAFTYQEPEPDLVALKSAATLSDPVNGGSQPKAIPGATVAYTIQVTNTGPGTVDDDSLVVVDAVPTGSALVIQDYDGSNPGPVAFVDLTPSSALTYTFSGLGNGADDIAFSDDGGSTFAYTPSDAGNGTDPAVTHIRINPKGAFAAAGSGNPAFRILFRVRVE
jgi:uncharacterized repeat protein (TIGR01451 family)